MNKPAYSNRTVGRKTRSFIITLLFAFMVCMTGCSSLSAPALVEKNTLFAHQIRYSGESLSVIAKWYTGKIANWKVLQRSNPDINAHHMSIGDTVYIPHKLMKRQDPLPQRFVRELNTTKSKKAVAHSSNLNAPLGSQLAALGDTNTAQDEQATPFEDQTEANADSQKEEDSNVLPTSLVQETDPERRELLSDLLDHE